MLRRSFLRLAGAALAAAPATLALAASSAPAVQAAAPTVDGLIVRTLYARPEPMMAQRYPRQWFHETAGCAYDAPETTMVEVIADYTSCSPEGRAEIMKLAAEILHDNRENVLRIDRLAHAVHRNLNTVGLSPMASI